MASSGRTGLRMASGVPGRGSRKLIGNLGRPELGQLADQLQALGVGLAHAEQDAAAQLHPGLVDVRQVWRRSSQVWVVTIWAKKDRAVSRLWL